MSIDYKFINNPLLGTRSCDTCGSETPLYDFGTDGVLCEICASMVGKQGDVVTKLMLSQALNALIRVLRENP